MVLFCLGKGGAVNFIQALKHFLCKKLGSDFSIIGKKKYPLTVDGKLGNFCCSPLFAISTTFGQFMVTPDLHADIEGKS